MRFAPIFAAAAAVFAPAIAFAHTGQHDHAGFAAGFAHPMGGVDHLLAMFAVGLLAARLGGQAIWAVPAAFLVMMAAGGLAGVAGTGLPFVEIGIGLSVVAFGAAVALRQALPVALAAGLAGAFAIFHGYAHGAEVPAGGAAFMAGFLAASAMLHVAGIAAGRLFAARGAMVLRAGGSLVAVAGVAVLAGLV